MDYSATLKRVELLVVTEADPTIYVSDELLRELAGGRLPIEQGGATYVDGVLAFGTPEHGLGRLAYRRVGWLTGHRDVHAFEQIG